MWCAVSVIMLVLFETPAGYALFKVLDAKKLKRVDDIYAEFATADRCACRACCGCAALRRADPYS